MISIQLPLKKGLSVDYLGYLFPQDPETGLYQVSATTDFGKMCATLVSLCPDQPAVPSCPDQNNDDSWTVVTLRLPNLSYTQAYEDKWLYYSRASADRLRALLSATLHQDFIAYLLKGLALGHKKKDIIEMFIASRRLTGHDPTDMLLKRAYRLEREKINRIARQLQRMAYYFDERLDKSGLL